MLWDTQVILSIVCEAFPPLSWIPPLEQAGAWILKAPVFWLISSVLKTESVHMILLVKGQYILELYSKSEKVAFSWVFRRQLQHDIVVRSISDSKKAIFVGCTSLHHRVYSNLTAMAIFLKLSKFKEVLKRKKFKLHFFVCHLNI